MALRPVFRPGAAAFALAMAGTSIAAPAAPDAARIVQTRGEVTVDGSTVRTAGGASAQVVLADGAMLAVAAGSEVELPAAGSTTVTLRAGGLRLDATAMPEGRRVDLPGRTILTNGFLHLQDCGKGCALPQGLYGRVVDGEAVLEYQGGRSVVRNRAFYWPAANVRPEILARPPALLDAAVGHADAEHVRAEAAEALKAGLEAFRDGDDALAMRRLEAVRAAAPGDAIVDYYEGLIALKRQDNAEALRLLQSYARQDPEGAATREVGKTLTLLSSSQLQQEVQTAIAREKEVVASPPEPGSIAVNAFVNRGDESYRAMAKGIAAMIIADLSKVPGLKVLEREKVQVLMNEMKLGDAGLADPASAVRSGRLMRAEKVIVGNFEVQ